MFLEPEARRLFAAGWAGEAKRMLAQFRTTHDLWADDPAFVSLLNRLREGSPEFGLWWEVYDVRTGGAGRKALDHPTRGVLHFDYLTFKGSDDPTLKLAIYTPV